MKRMQERDEMPIKTDGAMHKFDELLTGRRVGSVTAEGVALIRMGEMRRPQGERICSDPFAIRFVRPEILAHFRSLTPEEVAKDREDYEKTFPGHKNTILTRV